MKDNRCQVWDFNGNTVIEKNRFKIPIYVKITKSRKV